MPRPHTLETVLSLTIETEDEFRLRVAGTYHPAQPAWGGSRWERPINPPEAASFDIQTIHALEGKRWVPWPYDRERYASGWFLLSAEQLRAIEELAILDAQAAIEDDAEHAAELRRGDRVEAFERAGETAE